MTSRRSCSDQDPRYRGRIPTVLRARIDPVSVSTELEGRHGRRPGPGPRGKNPRLERLGTPVAVLTAPEEREFSTRQPSDAGAPDCCAEQEERKHREADPDLDGSQRKRVEDAQPPRRGGLEFDATRNHSNT